MKDSKKLKVGEVLMHEHGKQCQEYWQKDVGSSVFATGHGDDPAGAFLARPGKLRAQPHQMINECDH